MSNDSNQRELVQKVNRLVNSKFGGNWSKAFRHYAKSGGGAGLIDSDELKEMLSDARIGNGFTRGAWASGIIEKIDVDKDGKISWREFQEGVRA